MGVLTTLGLAMILIFGTPLSVAIQPNQNNTWVSSNPGTVTIYQIPLEGVQTVGLLAHDYLAGAEFERLSVGSQIDWVDGLGARHPFEVVEIRTYWWAEGKWQDSAGARWWDDEVIAREYGGGDLVLQTCVDGSAGVRFWHLVEAAQGECLMCTVHTENTSEDQIGASEGPTDISVGVGMSSQHPAGTAPSRVWWSRVQRSR
jgi:hypothetical protein